MKRYGLLCVFLIAVNANAQLVCSVDAAGAEEMKVASLESLRISEQTFPVLAAFGEFMNSRDWESGVAVGEQMNAEESAEFTILQQRQTALTIASLNIARRQKHIEILLALSDLARGMADDGVDLPEEDSHEWKLFQLIAVMEEVLPVDVDALLEASDECSLEQALLAQAQRVVTRVYSEMSTINEALAESVRLREKYGDVSPADMEEQDREYFQQRVEPVIESFQMQVAYAENLARLSLLAAVSLRILESQRNDQYEIPNDMEAIGTTWRRWIDEGSVSEQETVASGVFGVINDMFPSDFVSEGLELLDQIPE